VELERGNEGGAEQHLLPGSEFLSLSQKMLGWG
jgi:hypothetical protein